MIDETREGAVLSDVGQQDVRTQELEEENGHLREKVQGLAERLARLESALVDDGDAQDNGDAPDAHASFDRRKALKRLGQAAAASVGLLAVNGAANPRSASAGDGDNLIIGQFNSGSTTTELETSAVSTSRFSAATFFGDNDGSSSATDEFVIGVLGQANDSRGYGVFGESNNGRGVHGESSSGGTGVSGTSSGGTGVSGSGSTGVFGFASGGSGSGSVGVRGNAESGDYPFRAGSAGLAHFLFDPRSTAGPPSGTATGSLGVDSTGKPWWRRDSGNWGSPLLLAADGDEVVNDQAGFTNVSQGSIIFGTDVTDGHILGSTLMATQDNAGARALELQNTGTGTEDGQDASGAPLRLIPESHIPAIGQAGSLGTHTDGDFTDLFFLHDTSSDKDDTPSVVGKVLTSAFANFLEFITPTRVLDTRNSTNNAGTGGAPLDGGSGSDPQEHVIDISGLLPEGTIGFLATVTAVPTGASTDNGWLTVYESGAWPGTANLTWQNGNIISNMQASGLTSSETFEIAVKPNAAVHVVVDVVSVFVPE